MGHSLDQSARRISVTEPVAPPATLRECSGARGLNEAALRIHDMDRDECIQELLQFRDIPLDFNAAYLNQMSSDRLRHVLLAAVITVYTRKAG